jgi:hypothetical protein
MKFSVGDYVTIRYDIIARHRYNGVYVTENMARLAGKCFKIVSYRDEDALTIYYLDDVANGWAWTENMFGQVKIRKDISEGELNGMLLSSSFFLDMMDQA